MRIRLVEEGGRPFSPPSGTKGALTLQVRDCDTILDLKEIVSERLCLPPEFQSLVYAGEQLSDATCFNEINLGPPDFLPTFNLRALGRVAVEELAADEFEPCIVEYV